jgi:hypothetical protein
MLTLLLTMDSGPHGRDRQELDGAKDLPAMLDVLVEKLQLLEVPRGRNRPVISLGKSLVLLPLVLLVINH